METKITPLPTVWISQEAYSKMFQYVLNTSTEISGLGVVELIDKRLTITKVYLPRQKVSGSSTDLNTESVAQIVIELSNQGLENKLLCWWHSHVNMPTFWSGTDEATIQLLTNNSFFVSIVVNKNFDMLTRIEIFNPMHISFDNVTTKIVPGDFKSSKSIIKEIKDKVEVNTYKLVPRDYDQSPTLFPVEEDPYTLWKPKIGRCATEPADPTICDNCPDLECKYNYENIYE